MSTYPHACLQYFFGPDLLVSPVTNPVDSTTGLFTGNYWMPVSAIDIISITYYWLVFLTVV